MRTQLAGIRAAEAGHGVKMARIRACNMAMMFFIMPVSSFIIFAVVRLPALAHHHTHYPSNTLVRLPWTPSPLVPPCHHVHGEPLPAAALGPPLTALCMLRQPSCCPALSPGQRLRCLAQCMACSCQGHLLPHLAL